MREEFRTFTCRRYRVNTNLHYIYDTDESGKEYMVYSSCSLKDSGKKCGGVEYPENGHPCVLLRMNKIKNQ